MESHFTLSSELDRLSRSTDVRLLRRLCHFLLNLVHYLLGYFESPEEVVKEYNEWWNREGEQWIDSGHVPEVDGSW